MLWAGKLAVRRLSANWRSLLTVIAGAVLSATVGALVPLYTAAVAQVSMVEQLRQIPLKDAHIANSISLIPQQMPSALGEFLPTIRQMDEQNRALLKQYLVDPFPGWVRQTSFVMETGALDISPPADPDGRIPDPTSRAFLGFYEGWEQLTTLAGGQLPKDTPAEGADIEVVVSADAQSVLNIAIGDILVLDQGGPRGGWDTSVNIRARVVGVAAPLRDDDAFFMDPGPLRFAETRGRYQYEFSVLTTQASLERVAQTFLPDTPTRFGWRVLFDHTRLPFTRSPAARNALNEYANAGFALFVGRGYELNYVYYTRLIDFQQAGANTADQGVLLSYEQAIRSLNAPFGLLLLQIGGLVIFFLLVTAALVRRGERREIAMLQSRGAADSSIISIRALEAFLLCLLATLTAPIVAQQMLILITPFFARYPNLPLELTPITFAYSAGAAGLAFIALITTLRPVLRMPLVLSGGVASRADKQAWWQRYYLDVVLAILGVVALLRLSSSETPLFTTTAGSSATDPFLLMSPAFMFIGVGSVLLRLFPLLTGALSRVLATGRSLVPQMATWQVSREPLHYGRIAFLLSLAVGIGWFATSFRATVDRSQNDQAQYRVGTDIRFTERDSVFNVARARPVEAYTAAPGVEAAAVTWRRPFMSYQTDIGQASVIGSILAVDGETFARVVRWREDLGTVQIPNKSALPEYGEMLPFAPTKIGLWARFDTIDFTLSYRPVLNRLLNGTTLGLRLQDANGVWINAPLRMAKVEYESLGPAVYGLGGGGEFQTTGWAYYEADLSGLPAPLAEPVRFSSVYYQHRTLSQSGERFLRLTLAGFNATTSNNEQQPLRLGSNDKWEFAYDSGAFSVGVVTPGLFTPHGRGVLIQWDQDAQTSRMGLLLNYPALQPLPLITSTSLAGRLGLQPDQTFTLRGIDGIPIRFISVGQQNYYPSLYDATPEGRGWNAEGERQAFAITDRDGLLYMLNRRPSAAYYANEVWLKSALDVAPQDMLNAVDTPTTAAINVRSIAGALEDLQTDPLSRGLLGLMLLAFIVAMSLSVVGLLTYAALTANARRTEFGVLRALGLSSQRVIGQLAFEQAFVITIGLVLGVLLGALLTTQVVPRLAQDASGSQITPPFIVQVESTALAQYSLLLAIVIGLVLLASLLIVRGLSLTRTLRLGED
jgi:FtsX-like permease family